jgi:hypothetical protein
MNIIKILYKSFENKISSIEERELREQLLISSKLSRKKEYIENLRRTLMSYEPKTFSMDFENKLKQKIHSSLYPQLLIYNEIKFTFKKIVYVSASATLIILSISFIDRGSIDIDRIIGTEKLTIDDALYFEFSSLDKKLLGAKNGL